MSYALPTQNDAWTIGKEGFADILHTRNMDFADPRIARVSRKPIVLYSKTEDSDFTTIVAIVATSAGTAVTHYFIASSGKVFSWDATTAALAKLSTTNAPSTGFDSDAVIFNGAVHASGGTILASYDGVNWTQRLTGLATVYPRPLSVDTSQNYLAVGYQNTVKLYDTAYSLITTLTIPANFVITGMRYKNGNHYIATRDIGGADARLFIWNGQGSAAQSDPSTHADWIYSLEEYDSSIVVLTSLGFLLRYNGGGFDELAHFPVAVIKNASWSINAALSSLVGRCANRGMVASGKTLYINIDGGISSDELGEYLPTMPSGLWIYQPGVGLYHRGANNRTRRASNVPTDLTSNTFTFAAAHGLVTGDPIYPTSATDLAGLTANRLYYAIVVSATTLKLALSRYDAKVGTAVAVTGNVAGNSFIYDSFTSLGAVHCSGSFFPGAVGLLMVTQPPSILGSEIMYCGNSTDTDGTTAVRSALMSFGASHNQGSITLSPRPAVQITDLFKKIVAQFDDFYLPDTKVLVKYRIFKRFGFPTQYRLASGGLASWVSDTVFTIDSTSKQMGGIAIGDEVDIIEGAGAGYTAHILSLDTSGPVWQVTLDESIPTIVAGHKSEVVFDNWIKIDTITTSSKDISTNQLSESSLEKPGALVQLKIEMRGIRTGLRKMVLPTAPGRPYLT